jgi:two-component system, OmpR family, sensor histidine kinase TctE
VRSATPSLTRELTRRLVVGLLLIGVAGAAIAYLVASRFANRAYDRSLFDDVQVLAQQVHWAQGSAQIALSPDALLWLLADEGDEVIYRVTDLAGGRVLASNGNLGEMPAGNLADDEPYFRSTRVGDESLRIAYVKHPVGPRGAPALVEIGETTRKRSDVSRGILIGTVTMMSLLILVAVVLVRSGVRRALRSLKTLEANVAERAVGDMQPLDPSSAPSEVRGLIEALNHMMTRVAKSIDVQRQFLANAAHQLKTPIAGLRLQAQLALKAEPDGAVRDSIREVERRASHSAHLIEQLLTLAQADAHDAGLPSAEVDLAHVAQEVIERALPGAIAREIDLGFESDGRVARIVGNEVLLGELIANLVDNALRHGRPAQAGGRVTVTLHSDADAVELGVQDEGEGLSPEYREQVFRRFWRSDATSVDGAGLGLAIVKEIAERYRGKVSVASRPDYAGTRIAVRFAIAPPMPDAAA